MIYLITHRRIPPSYIVSLGIRLVFYLLFYIHMYNVINLVYAIFLLFYLLLVLKILPFYIPTSTPQHNNNHSISLYADWSNFI